jgi:uncharacterized protein YgiM (DUF1202 family)
MYGICNLAIIPLRVEPNDRSEQVSQVLFGEHFTVIDQQKQWMKIQLYFDQYEGWIIPNNVKSFLKTNLMKSQNPP